MTEAVRHVMDTCAWIEWFSGSELGLRLLKDHPGTHHCAVPSMVQLELSKWTLRELGEHRHDELLLHTMRCWTIDLDTTIALMAAEMHALYQLATADAVIYATARRHGLQVITCDKHFEGLPFVTYYDKRPAAG